MPLRAFLFFLRTVKDAAWREAFGSQCPYGHFCFFYVRTAFPAVYCFCGSQCPYGHFCFFYSVHALIQEMLDHDGSQCPYGHFCFFYLNDTKFDANVGKSCRNALTGIFVFSTWNFLKIDFRQILEVAMPLRAFLFFLQVIVELVREDLGLSQCPYGHFCFFY